MSFGASDQRTGTAHLLLDARALGGEAPLWDDRRQGLWWVDVRAPALHFWSPGGASRQWPMPSPIGFVALGAVGEVLVGLVEGLHVFDPDTGHLTHLFHPQPDLGDTRLNEGRVDPDGRLWFGIMQDKGLSPIGTLWRWTPGQPARLIFDGVHIPNGLSFDARTNEATFADNADGRLIRFPIDAPETARTLLAADAAPGEPDGCAIDAEGNVWNARFRGGCVVRIRRDGTIDRVVSVPVPNVAGLCFGGEDRRTLFITSLRVRMSQAELERYPLSGGLFTYRSDVPGAPEARIGGLNASMQPEMTR